MAQQPTTDARTDAEPPLATRAREQLRTDGHTADDVRVHMRHNDRVCMFAFSDETMEQAASDLEAAGYVVKRHTNRVEVAGYTDQSPHVSDRADDTPRIETVDVTLTRGGDGSRRTTTESIWDCSTYDVTETDTVQFSHPVRIDLESEREKVWKREVQAWEDVDTSSYEHVTIVAILG